MLRAKQLGAEVQRISPVYNSISYSIEGSIQVLQTNHKRKRAAWQPPNKIQIASRALPANHLHLEYPQSRHESQPDACSSWPPHSGHSPTIVDMPVWLIVSTAALFMICRSEDGRFLKRRSIRSKHSATACSGDVSSRSLNQTAWVPVTLLRLRATSLTSNPPRSILDASKPTPALIG